MLQNIPDSTAIAAGFRALLRDFVLPLQKRITPFSEPFSVVTGPSQLRRMDFKGFFTTSDGKRSDPFTITDAHSR